MPLKVILINGEGDGTKGGITSKNSLKVTNVDPIALELSPEELTARKRLTEFFSDKDDSAIKDLNVDGSTTTRIFQITGEPNKVKWVTEVRVVLQGANLEVKGQDFKRFGLATSANTPLTNGIKFYVVQGETITNFFINPITTIGDFMDYADEEPSNFVNSVGSQEDALYFKFKYDDIPIVLPQGTSDKIVFEIRDDLRDIDLYRVIAKGTQEVSED